MKKIKDTTEISFDEFMEIVKESNGDKEIFDNAYRKLVVDVSKEKILNYLLFDKKIYSESEFLVEIEKYKNKPYRASSVPAYYDYFKEIQEYYSRMFEDYLQIYIGSSNLTALLEKEPKDKTYAVEEIITKLKEHNLYFGWGINGANNNG